MMLNIRWILAATVLVCTLCVPLAPYTVRAEGNPTRLRLRQVRTTPDSPARVTVAIQSELPLGAYTLVARFDPAAVRLVGIQGGSEEFAAQPFSDPRGYSTGTVRFSGFQIHRSERPVGTCHIATLLFEPIGDKARARVWIEPVTVASTKGLTSRPDKRSKVVRVRSTGGAR